MPSARIKTLVVEDAYFLAEDLRTRGFVVEIVSPDKIPSAPVDLEVTLEECETAAALQRVDTHPEAEDLCVFVAPGALTEGYRPMRVVSLIPEAEAAVIAMPRALAVEPAMIEKVTAEAIAEEKVEEAIPVEAAVITPAVEETKAPELRAREIPVSAEVPTIAPEVWNVRIETARPVRKAKTPSYVEAGRRLLAWCAQLSRNERALQKTATLVAMGAVTAVSVLVLGSTIHRLDPVPPSVSESAMIPETTAASPEVSVPAPTQPKISPVPKVIARKTKAKSSRARNPEDDIVAKDFVIHFGRKPASRTQAKAKKTSGVKYYSDLQ